MAFTKKAYNLKAIEEAKISPLEELYILVGGRIWEFYRANPKDKATDGQGVGRQLLADATDGDNPNRYNALPVLFDMRNIQELGQTALIPPAHQVASFIDTSGYFAVKAGKVRHHDKELTALCFHLAKHSAVETLYLRSAVGEVLEDLSGFIQRLRSDENQVIAQAIEQEIELVLEPTIKNHQPYTEIRKENGITGLYRVIPKLDKDTGELSEKCEWLADPVEVVGVGISSEEYFSMLSFQAQGKTDRTLVAMPWAEIGERAGWQLLKQKGVRMTNSQRLKPHLADYLQDTQNKPIYDVVNETGWQADFKAYILPNGEVLGNPLKPVFFNSKSSTTAGYSERGQLSDWQREISAYLEGNYSMMLGVAYALAAPIIALIGAESFGVHLFGKSSAGKTTIANIASSIYGEPDTIRLYWKPRCN